MKKVTLFCVAALFSLLSFAQNDKGDIVKQATRCLLSPLLRPSTEQ